MIEVTPSPISSKEYESSGLNRVVPHLHMGMYLNDKHKNPCYCFDIDFLGDNRARFRKIWGKPHFYFRGRFYWHGWRFDVTVNGHTECVYVLTAKGKGTSIERTGDIDRHISPFDKAFADWLEKVLIDHPAST